MEPIKYLLPDDAIPTAWYNLQADFPEPLPPVPHPGASQPIGPADLAPLFADELTAQEVSTERWIEIPDEVRQNLAQWRCTPLCRARRLEKALQTPARIYYKREGVSPSGSHKPNTAVPQAYFKRKQGVKRIATETGAGQWGSSLAMACQIFGLECLVFMVKVSFNQKPYRRALMEAYGARCVASPGTETEAGARSSRTIPVARALSESPFPRQSKSLAGTTTRGTALAASSITSSSTRLSSAWRPRNSSRWPGITRM